MSPDLGTRNPHLCSPTQLLPGLFLLEKNLFALTSPERGSSLGPFEPETSRAGFTLCSGAPLAQGGGKPNTPSPPALWQLSDSPGPSDSGPSFTEHRVGGRHRPSPGSLFPVLLDFPPGPKSWPTSCLSPPQGWLMALPHISKPEVISIRSVQWMRLCQKGQAARRLLQGPLPSLGLSHQHRHFLASPGSFPAYGGHGHSSLQAGLNVPHPKAFPDLKPPPTQSLLTSQHKRGGKLSRTRPCCTLFLLDWGTCGGGGTPGFHEPIKPHCEHLAHLHVCVLCPLLAPQPALSPPPQLEQPLVRTAPSLTLSHMSSRSPPPPGP